MTRFTTRAYVVLVVFTYANGVRKSDIGERKGADYTLLDSQVTDRNVRETRPSKLVTIPPQSAITPRPFLQTIAITLST